MKLLIQKPIRPLQSKLLKTKHKIQAFTLSEMIVVVIITSIVIGMAFSVLSLVQKHMYSIQNNFNKNTELNKLEQFLWIDFNRYSNIKFNVNYNELIFTSEMDSISYKFTTDYIIKNLDTINIQLQNKSFFFDGEKIIKGQIDAIEIEASKAFQNQRLFVFKQNDATLFVNNLGGNSQGIHKEKILKKSKQVSAQLNLDYRVN